MRVHPNLARFILSGADRFACESACGVEGRFCNHMLVRSRGIVDAGVASIWAIDSHQQTQGPSTA